MNLKNKYDLKRAGVKKGVRPCTCLCIDRYIYVDSDKGPVPERYISRFHNQINFFITLINGGDFEVGDILINVGAI
jgi:hypothetical protein